MKNMKKIFWGLLTFCLLFSACSKEEEDVVDTTPVPLNLDIEFPIKNAVNEAYPETEWKTGAQLVALRTDKLHIDKVVMSWVSGNTFKGMVPSNETNEDSDFAFLYPADVFVPNTNDTLSQVLPLSVQDGTPHGISQIDYMWGKGNVTDNGGSFSLATEMTSLVGVCKFQFVSDGGSAIENICQIIVTAPSGELYQSVKIDVVDGEFEDFTKGSIKVSNETGMGNEVYVAFFPFESSLHFTINTADGKVYEAETSDALCVEQGNYYIVEPIVCSALPYAQIGDYYYNDATWSTGLNINKTCVGIVYALENESGKIDNSIVSSSHGRVVALEDCKRRLGWSSLADDVEGIKGLDVLCDTLSYGCLPYFEGSANSFFEDEAVHQLKHISIDETTGQIVNWCTSGALADFDGEYNTSFINTSLVIRPAGTYSSQYNRGMSGWYLPSVGELALLYTLHNSGVISSDKQKNFKDFEHFGYWSSSECGENEAWYVNFYSGIVTGNSKMSTYNVRTVIRF